MDYKNFTIMNNEDLKKQIAAIVEKQIKIATYCMDESLFPDSFQTEITNCFDQVRKQAEKLVDDFEPEMELCDIVKWIEEHGLSWKEEREILEKLSADEIGDYYAEEIKEDTNDIIIQCDSMMQREKIREFLETEVFTDTLRYNAAVENLY